MDLPMFHLSLSFGFAVIFFMSAINHLRRSTRLQAHDEREPGSWRLPQIVSGVAPSAYEHAFVPRQQRRHAMRTSTTHHVVPSQMSTQTDSRIVTPFNGKVQLVEPMEEVKEEPVVTVASASQEL
ncbi:hypothetical protein BDZ97DRAFT_1754138 [Flammula alnicola]|nr:hypothetical protein BDZ97DRAFT_1754138 [Flammula alnicola]